MSGYNYELINSTKNLNPALSEDIPWKNHNPDQSLHD
jgi:hypothetical protein